MKFDWRRFLFFFISDWSCYSIYSNFESKTLYYLVLSWGGDSKDYFPNLMANHLDCYWRGSANGKMAMWNSKHSKIRCPSIPQQHAANKITVLEQKLKFNTCSIIFKVFYFYFQSHCCVSHALYFILLFRVLFQ